MKIQLVILVTTIVSSSIAATTVRPGNSTAQQAGPSAAAVVPAIGTEASIFDRANRGNDMSIFPTLPHYSSDLSSHGTGVSFPVQFAYHHIIPRQALHRFFTNIARVPDLLRSLTNFWESIPDVACEYLYQGMMNAGSSLRFDDADQIRMYDSSVVLTSAFTLSPSERAEYIALVNRLLPYRNAVDQNTNISVEQMLNMFNRVLMNLPFNLFVGPEARFRTDDPGARFETGAQFLMDQQRYNTMLDINLRISTISTRIEDGLTRNYRGNQLAQYNAETATMLRELDQILLRMNSMYHSPIPFNRANWQTDYGHGGSTRRYYLGDGKGKDARRKGRDAPASSHVQACKLRVKKTKDDIKNNKSKRG